MMLIIGFALKFVFAITTNDNIFDQTFTVMQVSQTGHWVRVIRTPWRRRESRDSQSWQCTQCQAPALGHGDCVLAIRYNALSALPPGRWRAGRFKFTRRRESASHGQVPSLLTRLGAWAGYNGRSARLPNCLPPGWPAADQPLYFLFLEFNKKPPLPFSRFLASTPYSSELFLVSCSLFHFFNYTLNPVGIPVVYSVGIPTVATL
jgi:hypothetical protein